LQSSIKELDRVLSKKENLVGEMQTKLDEKDTELSKASIELIETNNSSETLKQTLSEAEAKIKSLENDLSKR
jgi:predicted  nucleic acid-binding Zn-ribbon protein